MKENFFSKKPVKISLFVLAIILLIIFSSFIAFFAITAGYKIDKNKLIDLSKTITFYSDDGNVLTEESNEKEIISISDVKDYTKNAFIAIEDKRFYQHKGVDVRSLFRALAHNVFSFSFKEGASTITQQLVKNTHLSSEKTFKRKLIEIKLSKELEKKYSKNEILEKYLNTIYFGENCYGIAKASKRYFGVSTKDLTISQSALLAGIIKAPATYSPSRDLDKSITRRNVVLNEMKNQGFIDENEYQKAINEQVFLATETEDNGLLSLIKNETNDILEKYKYSAKKISVYTTINTLTQKLIEDKMSALTIDAQKAAVILNKNNEITAINSTSINSKRQMGSTIKPLAVYAPAIENDIINESTKILDEKTDFNGYSPQNYGNKYYGEISAKTALSKSLNVVAAKTLQKLGVEKAREYLAKMNLLTNKNDNNLALALGSTENGESLINLVSAYSVFLNEGEYKKPTIIKKIVLDENKNIWTENSSKTRVFGKDTTYIVNDMLKDCVENGTAKKLKELNANLRAKTGTVGNSSGNTDAYAISYTPNYLMGVWLGSEKNLLDNNVTGSGIPCEISKNIWKEILKNSQKEDFSLPDSVCEIELDKISYEKENQLVLADDIAPKRYVVKSYFKKNNIPNIKSTRFSSPVMEEPKISVKNCEISIELCLAEYYNAMIYKGENANKTLVHDTSNNKTIYCDKNTSENSVYVYTIIPYFKNGEEKIFGKEIKIKAKTNVKEDIDLNKFWEENFNE